MKKGKTQVDACDRLLKNIAAYREYLDTFGNECAYTDRILEDVKKDIDLLMKDYNNLTKEEEK